MIYRSFLPALAFAAIAAVSLPAFAEDAWPNFLSTNDSTPASAEDATPDLLAADNSTLELTPVREKRLAQAITSMHLAPATARVLRAKLKAGEVKLVWFVLRSAGGGAISVTTTVYTLPYRFPTAGGSIAYAVPVAANGLATVKIHVTAPLTDPWLSERNGDRQMPHDPDVTYQVF